MSASDSNIEKQKQRHRGPILGISLVLLWAGALLVGLLIWIAYQSANPTAESPAEIISGE